MEGHGEYRMKTGTVFTVVIKNLKKVKKIIT